MALKPADYVMAVVLLVVVASPLILKAFREALKYSKRQGVIAAEPSASEWRSQWVQTLMDLQADLEPRSDQLKSLTLCRQLIWEILGGGPK